MDTAFFCDLDALTAGQRERHRALAEKLRPLVNEFQELPNGYAALFISAENIEAEIQDFLFLEKLCCPFFTLQLQVGMSDESQNQTYTVRITGPGDIKPFIRAEFRIP